MADSNDTAAPAGGKDLGLKTAKTEIKKKRIGSRFPFIFTAAVMLLVMSAQQSTVLFDGMDNAWTGSLFRWRGLDPGDERIVIIEIDDASLRKLGSFPLPRGVYGDLLDKLFAYGVKTAAVDVLFIERSRPKEDAKLVDASRRHRDKIVHSVMFDEETGHENRILPPFPELAAVKPHIGIVSQRLIDSDGQLRESALVIGRKLYHEGGEFSWADDEKSIGTLGMAALALYEGKPLKHYTDAYGVKLRLNYRGIGFRKAGTQIVDGQKRELIAVREGFHQIPLWKVLSGGLSQIDKAFLDGSIVLIGSTAVGYFDHYPNAFREQMPGVLVHATLIDNILNGRYLRKAPIVWTHLLILVFALIAFQLLRLGPIRAAVIVVSVIAVWGLATYQAFIRNTLFHFWPPVFALVVPFIVLMIYKVVLEQQAKKEVREMFGQYVSPEVVNILVQDPSKLSLGGQRRDMTMFFLDIAHFTTISEKMQPEKLIQFLNTYLTALTDDILRNNGVVDKYIGDCIMAFWNAPLDEPDHRRKACLAAIDCIATIERLNTEYVDPTIPEKPAVRIGLNSGEVIVGNTGSARKLAYTVLGDEVNLSSRLEGANKFFGSTVMVSENTFKGAESAVEARVLGNVRVVGKETPIKVYELLAHQGKLSAAWQEALPHYAAGIERFYEGAFAAAKAAFAKVVALIPGDKPSKLYMSACDDYLTIPPQGDWKVFNLTSK